MRAAVCFVFVISQGCLQAPRTAGQECFQLAEVDCSWADRCASHLDSGAYVDCLNAVVASCCMDDNLCDEVISKPDADFKWTQCVEALNATPCTALDPLHPLPKACGAF